MAYRISVAVLTFVRLAGYEQVHSAHRTEYQALGVFTVLEPATVGNDGHREPFQVGEALDGRPLIARQHPHDLFTQLTVVWRITLNDSTGFKSQLCRRHMRRTARRIASPRHYDDTMAVN